MPATSHRELAANLLVLKEPKGRKQEFNQRRKRDRDSNRERVIEIAIEKRRKNDRDSNREKGKGERVIGIAIEKEERVIEIAIEKRKKRVTFLCLLCMRQSGR